VKLKEGNSLEGKRDFYQKGTQWNGAQILPELVL
jgi:hypothetical protein